MLQTTAKYPGGERDLRCNYRKSLGRRICRNWQLYLFLLPAVAYFLLFRYYPMFGLQIAFKNYKPTLSMWGSPWADDIWKYFKQFFVTPAFKRALPNTLAISVGTLIISFPVPIILALLLNQLTSKRYKKIVQTTLYAPHFISTVVMVGIVTLFFALKSGIVNHLIEMLGGERIHFMAEPSWFRPLYIGSEIWQSAGWGSILYLAALSGINPELHEAAIMDGANKFQRVWHIDIPGILPTIVIMFILNSGKIMAVGQEKALLMQNSLNQSTSEIISTYVYKRGLQNHNWSFATAVGMFESVVNLVLLCTVNFVSKRVTESSLF